MASKYRIPVINMKELSLPTWSEKLIAACREWGCFRIINHGIWPELMVQMKAVSGELTDLPVEIKMRNCKPVSGKGYTSTNQISPVFEGLGCYDMTSPHALHAFFDQLYASPYQREVITKYLKAIHALSMELSKELASGLGLVENDLFNAWPCQLRINKFNYTPEYVGSTGAVLHTDPSFLTILQDDELVAGLEVVHEETGEYIPVYSMEGSLVVNLGDFAHIWSNGRLLNVKHRVQCYEGNVGRVSIACFVLGPKLGELEVPLQLIDSDHPRLYRAISFEDYRMLRINVKSPTGVVELLRIES